jgi:peptidyl-Lys metalloendopeptidase
MYLCGSFWTAPLTGYDSKAGTIIYLASLFPSNGNLENNALSFQNAQALAISDPDKAIMTAVNHEYFAESFLID